MKYENLQAAQAAGAAPWQDEDPRLSTDNVAVFADGYPVTAGHLLCVPRWNNNVTIHDAFKAAFDIGHAKAVQGEWEAYNVGMNCGTAAGQTVLYPHVHLIPRRTGDCADAVGGVRAVIPGQANYKKSSYKPPDTK
jgi:diadenosine tetraphosphate (Ap4A) HIT family hydrolase